MTADQILDVLQQHLINGHLLQREVTVSDPSAQDRYAARLEEKFRIQREVGLDEARWWYSQQKATKWSRRIDGLLSDESGVIAFEVKRTFPDFRNDTPEKRLPWLFYSNAFYYVTPPGLIELRHIPAETGLIEVDESGAWIAIHAPWRKAEQLPRGEQ